jgi:hypothetical protein
MSERVVVEFQVIDKDKFLVALQKWDEACAPLDLNGCISFRADDYVSKRQALVAFVDRMEEKLRKNEYKRNWREKPIDALFKLAMLEIQEFKTAKRFFTVGEARAELPDAANFLMMCYDRMGMFDQDRNLKEQQNEVRTIPTAD